MASSVHHNRISILFGCHTAKQNVSKEVVFFCFFLIISGVDLRVWGSIHGKRTTSITTNHPCLITSVELDRSWEGFSASEKIPWSGGWGVSWIGNKAAELLWTVWFGSRGLCLSSSFSLKPPADNIMGKGKPQFDQKLGGQGTHLVTTTVGIF